MRRTTRRWLKGIVIMFLLFIFSCRLPDPFDIQMKRRVWILQSYLWKEKHHDFRNLNHPSSHNNFKDAHIAPRFSLFNDSLATTDCQTKRLQKHFQLGRLLDRTSLFEVPSVEFRFDSAGICNFDLKKMFLLYIVVGRIEDIAYRKRLRRCWRNIRWTHLLNFKMLFLVGESSNSEENKKVIRERENERDVMQANVPDGDNALLIQALLVWVKRECTSVEWIVLSPSDTFVNLFHMIRILKNEATTYSTTGLVCQGPLSTMSADNFFRNFDLKEEDLDNTKISYCKGGSAYAFKGNVVNSMLSFLIPKDYLKEGLFEAYLTGIVPLLEPKLETHCYSHSLNITKAEVKPYELALLFNEAIMEEFYPYRRIDLVHGDQLELL